MHISFNITLLDLHSQNTVIRVIFFQYEREGIHRRTTYCLASLTVIQTLMQNHVHISALTGMPFSLGYVQSHMI